MKDLVDSLVHVSYNICSIRTATIFILLSRKLWPTAISANAIHLRRINRKVRVRRRLTVFSKKAVHVNADFKLAHIMTGVFIQRAVVFKQWPELRRITSDDRKHHGQSQPSRTLNRLRRSAHGNPYRQLAVLWSR